MSVVLLEKLQKELFVNTHRYCVGILYDKQKTMCDSEGELAQMVNLNFYMNL